MVLLEDLGVKALEQVCLEAPDSGYQHTKAYFESCNTRLSLSEAAVHSIALEAAKSPRLGARALREVFRRVIRGYEFEPDRFADANRVIHLDAPEIENALKG